ncbi:MAG: hypothetical protein GC139_09885 [Sideroxydans sp.]|nr:hypothetical protein [Sideroxydans sp.]
MKIIFSILVFVLWFLLMMGNLIGAEKTRNHAMLEAGLSLHEAQKKTTLTVAIFALIITAVAAGVLWLIWT